MKKKIAIDASVFREPASGVHLAAKNSVLAELKFLAKKHNTLLLANFSSEHSTEELQPAGFVNSSLGRIFWQQFFLSSLLKRHSVDLLHALAYTLPLNCKTPALLTVHDIIALEYPSLCSLQNICHMKLLLPRSIKKAAKCAVPSTDVANRMIRKLQTPAEKIEVIPWGVDFKRFNTKVTETEIVLPEKYFLFVGNLEPKKNLLFLLKAYAEFSENNNDYPLVIVGRAAWKCKALVKTIKTWCYAGKVIWLGRLSDDDLTAVYQRATAFIMPSLAEGFGLPVLEAMAAGIPVLHSNQEALSEAAGDAGLKFTLDNSTELKDKMELITENKQLRTELIETGIKRAQEFSWEKSGKHYAELINSM